MSAGINTAAISGNITREPELRSTANGTQVLSFGVAVNERAKQQDGTWGDRASFIDCTLFGKRAEALSGFLHKGTHVMVQGRLRQQRWDAKDGSHRSKVEVIADEVDFTSRQQGGGYQQQGYGQQQGAYGAQQPAYGQQQGYGQQQPQQAAQQQPFQDEIPF